MYGNPGSVDLRSLIADGGAASLGDVTDTDSVLDGAPTVSGSTLRFAFRNEPANADKTAVIAVHVTGADNYLDYTITVTVTVDSRIVPTGQPTLTPAAITYGQPLRTIALSGALRDGGTVVEGTFVWNTPDVILPAGSQAAEWTFTPSGSRYATTSGTASVTVREAALTDVSVRQDGALTYTGTALSAPVITSAATVDGSAVTFTYSLAKDGAYGDTVPTLTDVAAHTVWYKAEAANHETVTGSFTVTIGKAALTSVSVRQDGALAYNGKGPRPPGWPPPLPPWTAPPSPSRTARRKAASTVPPYRPSPPWAPTLCGTRLRPPATRPSPAAWTSPSTRVSCPIPPSRWM